MTDSSAVMVEKINPEGILPPPGNLHAHVVLAPATCRLAFLAGNVALDEEGNLVGPGDHYAQAAQAYRNIRIAVEAVGGRHENIVQLTTFVVGYQDEILDDILRAGAAAFGADWPVTANTLVGVEVLGHKDFLVEVNAIAAV